MTETVTDAPAPAARASLWEDFIDIFYAPREVYARRREAGFGFVLVILTVVMTALFFVAQGPLADAFAAEFRRGMEQAGAAGQQMTAEQMEGARRMGSIFGTVSMLVGIPLGVVLVGLALWGMGKLFGSVATAGMAILVVTYAQFPRVLQTVALLLQGLLFNPPSLAQTSLGPARFFDPDATSAVLMATLMRLDVFYLWSTVLIAIGAQVLGRVPKAQSYLLAALVWVVGGLVPLLGALARG
jgi:hypothetical protein